MAEFKSIKAQDVVVNGKNRELLFSRVSAGI